MSQVLTSAEVRDRFIEYFKRHGHSHVGSSSLIPANDPTLLFTNAGMNQFKNLFLGIEKRDYNRAVTSQKCVRAGGKHNDLENVGFTARHHTFFEMLGNFSFGDYFKKEAIHFAWDFLTADLGIPKEKLYVTVFQSDDEAADIWHKQEGVPKDRIFRFGEKDNFWRMGDTGPCGPCSEIFYDHGPSAGKESDPYKGIVAGEDRFVEIWNLVFMQFYEKSPGVMDPLPKPSVDTGSGLERVVAAIQGKINNYDTDLFAPMIDRACALTGVKYGKDPEITAALRVLADHSRSSAFLLADGALPSNEGRGYVLRRIMRRAIRYGRKVSEKHSLMPEMMDAVIESMGAHYPELKQRRDHILTTIKEEESRFISTLDQGTAILNEELRALKAKNKKEVPGEVLFKLYDTFGFPVDLTRLMANEQGFSVDEEKFEQQMNLAKEKAKTSWKGKSLAGDEGHLFAFTQDIFKTHKATIFSGYDTTTGTSSVISLSNGASPVDHLSRGQNGILVTTETPFYAESGGQVGDEGIISGSNFKAVVRNTTKQNEIYLHHIEVQSGEVKVKDTVHLGVSSAERRNIMANHSATHLMHAALRKVLGNHVTQAGSLVDAGKLRFDFTHNKPMSARELHEVESLVNAEISKATPVQSQVMKHKEALQMGAMALFGEKYGSEVRVLKMGDFSTELCGGTHVSNTSQIRLFKILSESGVSAGVRRIEAMAGASALDYLMKNAHEYIRARLAAGVHDDKPLADWIESKKDEVKNLEKQVKKAQGSQVNVDEIVSGARAFHSKAGDSKIVLADLNLDDREVLAQVSDHLKNKIQSGIVVIVGKGDSTHPLIVSVSKDLNPGLSAGNILKELATIMGGKGGGRPDFAQGAVPDRSKLPEAFKKAIQMVGLS
jgi:alanyl-tRNA synthetase